MRIFREKNNAKINEKMMKNGKYAKKTKIPRKIQKFRNKFKFHQKRLKFTLKAVLIKAFLWKLLSYKGKSKKTLQILLAPA